MRNSINRSLILLPCRSSIFRKTAYWESGTMMAPADSQQSVMKLSRGRLLRREYCTSWEKLISCFMRARSRLSTNFLRLHRDLKRSVQRKQERCSSLQWYSMEARAANSLKLMSLPRLDKMLASCAWQSSGQRDGRQRKYLRCSSSLLFFGQSASTRSYSLRISCSLSPFSSSFTCRHGYKLCSHPQKSSLVTCRTSRSDSSYAIGRFPAEPFTEVKYIFLSKMGFRFDCRMEELVRRWVSAISRWDMAVQLPNILEAMKEWLSILQLIFSEMNRNWAENPQERIEGKLREAQASKAKAVDARVKELQREVGEGRGESREMGELKRELEDFRARMKSLYTSIFQGSTELSIRKRDLVLQIKGDEGDEYQAY